ncbi:MAG: hypothetical protein KJ645_04830 [Planctomycetes bacterium]|nr:hypothetical protein [Planctomycetota bacterium]
MADHHLDTVLAALKALRFFPVKGLSYLERQLDLGDAQSFALGGHRRLDLEFAGKTSADISYSS